MRIGIDARLWNESGVGRYTRNLVTQLQRLDKKNEYVLFVLERDKERFTIYDLRFKIVVVNILWHTIEEQIKFPSLINQENVDLMHFPYFSVPIFYNKPFVVTIHDLILHHYATGKASTHSLPLYWFKLLGYKFVIANVARNAKKIIAVSNATKNEIIKHLKVNEEKVVVTYEGVEDKIRNPNTETRNNSQNTKYQIPNTKYFLYVGNAYPHKNLQRLIEAHNILISKYPNISLVLVGKEDYFYKRLKEKVKKIGLENSIIFLGLASDEELLSLYKNALALISPSVMEGFGLTLIEAMANECLVLCSDIPVHREVAGKAGLYFDPFDLGSIRKRMKEVCFNDLNHFSNNIKEGLERVKMFSWQKMAKETLEVYVEVLGKT